MEALLCKRLGDPTSSSEPPIELTQNHPIPKLDSPTAVRIKIKATSLTFATYLKILGKYQEKHPLPFIPGSDYAGTVDAVGPSVTKFKVGDYVCAVFPHRLLRFLHRPRPVPIVLLVLGAAGGVDLAAVQIGKICGAVVIAATKPWQAKQFAYDLTRPLTYELMFFSFVQSPTSLHEEDLMNQDVTTSIKEFLKSRNLKGVDVLYDPVGGNLAKETRKLLNWGAQILVIGFASSEIPFIPANIILVKNTSTGCARGFSPGVTLMDGKGLDYCSHFHTYSLSKANLAFSAIKDRKAIGKVMIVFDDLGTEGKQAPQMTTFLAAGKVRHQVKLMVARGWRSVVPQPRNWPPP
ncbi:hypothetical protein GOBAR_AA17846 [Gossypium barbadense]|uniref:Enoyl reductase (ER) domain-containing protein n=1 Tax=Gossypium barbadense TaxID=3634 RepID=A0A2P5XHG8_GOSBA|nr:hypothetical protein GOBAR_AA17846 [Gossypium barbadense]